MASAASLRRKFAPKANTKVEVSTDPKPSIWTRIKTAAKRIVGAAKRVANTAKRGIVTAAKTVARPFKAAASFVARKTATVRHTIATFATNVWTRALKPFLGGVTLGVTLFAFLYAPVLFIAALVVGGLFFLAFSKGVEALEARAAGSRLARFALTVIEVLGRVAIVLETLATAFIAGVLCVASLPFAIFTGMYLVLKYIGSERALMYSVLTFCVLTGNIGIVLVWVMWRMYLAAVSDWVSFDAPTPPVRDRSAPSDEVYEDLRSFMSRDPAFDAAVASAQARMDAADVVVPTEAPYVPKTAEERAADLAEHLLVRKLFHADRIGMGITPADAPNHPEWWTRGNFLVAKGTEEFWGTSLDVAPVVEIEVIEAEVIEAAAPVNKPCLSCGTTEGALRVATDSVETHGLCSACFDIECEVDAIDRTGVSLKARNVEFSLNDVGLRATPEYADSAFDADHWRWVLTAWFRDRSGINHERVWTVLSEGKPHGTVRYNHTKKVMHGLDANQRLLCVVSVRRGQKAYSEALAAAQTQVTDELNKRADLQTAVVAAAFGPTLTSLPSTGG